MQEIIEQLRELHQQPPVALELPDEDLLVEIQEQLLIHLPADYKAFLLEVSDVVYGALEPATVCDPNAHTYLPEMAAQAWADGLPREFIPLCMDRGFYYCVAQDGRVLQYNLPNRIVAEWQSIWQWVEEVWLQS